MTGLCSDRPRRGWLVWGLLGLLAGAGPSAPKLPPLNEKVVEFARAHVGKRVGDGICITLALEALKQAGARRTSFDVPEGAYVWGKEVPTFKQALPGDILQFHKAVFAGKRWITKTRWESWHEEYPHHTAIVSGVKDDGKIVTVLHQNVGGEGRDENAKRTVREDTIRTDSLQKGGWVRVYRPIALEDGDPDGTVR